MSQNEYLKFGDFAEKANIFEGDKKRIDELLNKEILILRFKIKDSKQQKGTSYATVQFRYEDNEHIFFTGSSVLIDQLTKYKDNLPFYATIKKIDKYFTFT